MANRNQRIIVTEGLRGFFAALVDDDGPIESAPCSHRTAASAALDAREWAACEDIPFVDTKPSCAVRAWYAGVGSRETPGDILRVMESIGTQLARSGFGLRSGGAPGADTAFESGADQGQGAKQIFIPWSGFEERHESERGVIVASRLESSAEAERIAAAHHPVWDRLSQGARKLHARNVNQLLSDDLCTPARFVICWAKSATLNDSGRPIDVPGGTGTAVRIAAAHSIPVFHLGIPEDLERIQKWLMSMSAM